MRSNFEAPEDFLELVRAWIAHSPETRDAFLNRDQCGTRIRLELLEKMKPGWIKSTSQCDSDSFDQSEVRLFFFRDVALVNHAAGIRELSK